MQKNTGSVPEELKFKVEPFPGPERPRVVSVRMTAEGYTFLRKLARFYQVPPSHVLRIGIVEHVISEGTNLFPAELVREAYSFKGLEEEE
jgi:hypothetical protein